MTQEHPTLRWVWPVILSVVFVALVGFRYANPVHKLTNVLVVHKWHDFRYEFAYLDSGEKFTQDICPDYEPPEFSDGLILKELYFLELENGNGVCWSLNPDNHAGYFKRRDANGRPIFYTGNRTTQTATQ